MPVLGTKLLQGMGFGNQLFAVIAARCLAERNGMKPAVLNRDLLDKNLLIGGKKLFSMDYGEACAETDFPVHLAEKDERIFLADSEHDLSRGCFVSGADERLFAIRETYPGQNVLLSGNLQAWDYLAGYEEKIRRWLQVNPDLEHLEYAKENICVLNIRGGEYAGNPELFVERRYWLDAMKVMKARRADMKFIAVTDDPEAAAKVLPEVRAEHGDLAHDYTIVKNASYLILSNSSFACFPAFTGRAQLILAPKYWARHNVSDGFWSSEQNIYPSFTYLDREGNLISAKDCKEELEDYKARTGFSERIGKKPTPEELEQGRKKVQALHRRDLVKRSAVSLKRRLHLVKRSDSL